MHVVFHVLCMVLGGCLQEYVAFLARLLQPDLSRRYTAAEALQDPWILVRAAINRPLENMHD